MIEKINGIGCTVYILDGEYHNPKGPAIEWHDGDFSWCLYGKKHRYYGPQSEADDWWIHGTWCMK